MSDVASSGPADEGRLRAVIGPRADFYLSHWRKMDETGKKTSWNWAACFLNVFWFAYRKMWGPMVAMGLLYVVTSPFLDPTHKTLLKIVLVVLVGASFVTGSLGNRLYRARVMRILAATGGADAAKRGGVSLGAALAALVVVAVLSAVAGMIPAMMGRG